MSAFINLRLLDEELQKFYLSLLKSESRHFQDYLALAKAVTAEPIQPRVAHFLAVDRELVLSEDAEFRFHSGVLASV